MVEDTAGESDPNNLSPQLEISRVAASIEAMETPDCLSTDIGEFESIQADTSAPVADLLAEARERIEQLEEDMEIISKKYHELRRTFRVIDCESSYCDADGLGVQVVFMNSDVGRRHRHKVEEFLATIMQAEKQSKKDPLTKISLRPNARCLLRPSESDAAPEETIQKACTAIGCAQFHKDFMVDRLGWPLVSYDTPPVHTPGWSTVLYSQVFTSPLPVNEQEESAKAANSSNGTNKMSCFNCGGDHAITDCDQPRDEAKVRKNKAEFQRTRMTYRRYHVDEAKYGRLAPGMLSEKLQEALGLPSDGRRLPSFIYRMRQLGYPPGWLREAEQCGSGLAMFDKHGREVNLDGDLMEDGECPEYRSPSTTPTVDADKIIDYPGFNAKPDDGVIDEYKLYDVTPMAWLRVRQSLVDRLVAAGGATMGATAVSGAKRSASAEVSNDQQQSKKSRTSTNNDRDGGVEGHDMELSDDGGSGDEKVTSGGLGGVDGAVEAVISPPLLDDFSTSTLEEQRQLLLLKLSEAEGSSADTMVATDGVCIERESAAASTDQVGESAAAYTSSAGSSDQADKVTSEASRVVASDIAEVSTQQHTPSRSHSIGVQQSTPVPSISAITHLPNYDNFKHGIEDHIPYENLPDATGTYQRMTAILQRVREVVPKRKKRKN